MGPTKTLGKKSQGSVQRKDIFCVSSVAAMSLLVQALPCSFDESAMPLTAVKQEKFAKNKKIPQEKGVILSTP